MPESFIMQMKSDWRNRFRPSFWCGELYFGISTKNANNKTIFGLNKQRALKRVMHHLELIFLRCLLVFTVFHSNMELLFATDYGAGIVVELLWRA